MIKYDIFYTFFSNLNAYSLENIIISVYCMTFNKWVVTMAFHL